MAKATTWLGALASDWETVVPEFQRRLELDKVPVRVVRSRDGGSSVGIAYEVKGRDNKASAIRSRAFFWEQTLWQLTRAELLGEVPTYIDVRELWDDAKRDASEAYRRRFELAARHEPFVTGPEVRAGIRARKVRLYREKSDDEILLECTPWAKELEHGRVVFPTLSDIDPDFLKRPLDLPLPTRDQERAWCEQYVAEPWAAYAVARERRLLLLEVTERQERANGPLRPCVLIRFAPEARLKWTRAVDQIEGHEKAAGLR